jgi:hypothetical protein
MAEEKDEPKHDVRIRIDESDAGPIEEKPGVQVVFIRDRAQVMAAYDSGFRDGVGTAKMVVLIVSLAFITVVCLKRINATI